jgi:spore coat protein H
VRWSWARNKAGEGDTSGGRRRKGITAGGFITNLVALASVVLVTAAGTAGVCAATTNTSVDPSDAFFSNGVIPSVNITLDEQALAALRLHPRVYVAAAVREGAVVYSNVGVHLKGQYGTFQGSEGKPSLTLKFDKFVPGQRFHGLDKLHLNNSVSDPSYMTELLCREPFRAAGVPAARVAHARVSLNGRDRGLYVLVEGFNKSFLRRHFKNPDGNLYDSEFMHDVTYPLRKGSGDGPADHSDLRALATAAREHGARAFPEPQGRARPLGAAGTLKMENESAGPAVQPYLVQGQERNLDALLDMDRFYSFLALELMMGHSDGYARARNNYWLYHDPDTGKFVFLPHGMDQVFWQPQSSLVPDLKGVVAQAVLQTAPGLRLFRARCTLLFTNHLSRLTNRVEEVRVQLRPIFADMGTNALAQHDRAVVQLQERMTARIEFLRKQVLAPPPEAFVLEVGGQTALTHWQPGIETGQAKLEEKASSGSKFWEARLLPSDQPVVATWQTRLRVSPGRYQVFARVSAEPAVFRGPTRPVMLRVWGGIALQAESMAKGAQTLGLLQIFEVRSLEPEEVLVQCELRSGDEPVTFALGPVTLARLE